MNKNYIIEKLNENGIIAEEQVIIKNGVKFEGFILIKEGTNCHPIMYFNGFDDEDEYILEAIKVANENKTIDIAGLINKESIRKNVVPCLMRNLKCTEKYVTIPVLGDLVKYYKIVPEELIDERGFGSITITKDLLNSLDITLEELDKWALDNLDNIATITPLIEIIANSLPEELREDFIEGYSSDTSMYIVSNKYRLHGASACLSDKVMNEVADKFNSNKLFILPSSVHEVIVIPYNGSFDAKDLCGLVSSVNNEVVPEEEVLSDHAYVWQR